jgi:hypothetical protein
LNVETYNQALDRVDPAVRRKANQFRCAVISIHGMKTAGLWQKELASVLQDFQIRHEAVDYGWVLPGVLLKKTKHRVAKLILDAYERQSLYVEQVSAVAHSFGGLSLGHTLQTKPAIRLERVILFGCILSEQFPWRELHQRGQVGRVLNERTRRDIWVKLAPLSGLEDAGWAGFCGFDPCPGVVYDRDYQWTDHSDLQYRTHYERMWVPFLLGETPDRCDPRVEAPAPWRIARRLHQRIARLFPRLF